MRLLVFGHWSDTGFGVVTEALGRRFVQAGVDVRIMAGNLRGEPVNGPLGGRVWGLDMLGQHFQFVPAQAIAGTLWPRLDPTDEWKPDAVLVIADMSGLLNYIGDDGAIKPWQETRVLHYCPIEGDNLPVMWRDVWNKIAEPVAMANYGAQVIGELMERPIPMIYHGVDTDVFRPAKPLEAMSYKGHRVINSESAKAAFGLDPSRKIVFRSDRFVPRKFYDRFITAMAEVVRLRDDVDILIHCRAIDEGGDLSQEIARLPAEISKRFFNSNAHNTYRGLTRPDLAVLMNAADVYVSTTSGEGFGLNLAESLACEVPVVCTGWAGEKEVVAKGGFLVPPLHDSYGEPVRYHSKFGMDWVVPDPKAFVKPVLDLLDRPSRRRELGREGRAHVIRNFSWDAAAASFIDLLLEEPDADRLAS